MVFSSTSVATERFIVIAFEFIVDPESTAKNMAFRFAVGDYALKNWGNPH
jgi:hypothetical protein